RALWTQLGSHASIAENAYARTGPASAFWWLTRERDADIAHRSRWMLRVVDAPAAIAARGFPAATSLTVPLRITDEARPANSGRRCCAPHRPRAGKFDTNRCSRTRPADGEHLVGLSYARHPIRVLGVDPGLTRCGVGVVEGAPGRALTLIRVGVIRTSADVDIAARLLAIETEIEAWLDECRPDAVAVERVFSQQNVRTVMGTAQAGAIAIACAARRGLPVALHTPSEVKAA